MHPTPGEWCASFAENSVKRLLSALLMLKACVSCGRVTRRVTPREGWILFDGVGRPWTLDGAHSVRGSSVSRFELLNNVFELIPEAESLQAPRCSGTKRFVRRTSKPMGEEIDRDGAEIEVFCGFITPAQRFSTAIFGLALLPSASIVTPRARVAFGCRGTRSILFLRWRVRHKPTRTTYRKRMTSLYKL